MFNLDIGFVFRILGVHNKETIMDTYNSKDALKNKNWTAIIAVTLVLVMGAYAVIDSRISKLSIKYRTEKIVQNMNANDELQKNECDNPFASEINKLKSKGMRIEGADPIDIVSPATAKRCNEAKAKIAENNRKSQNAKLIVVPNDYITKNFF